MTNVHKHEELGWIGRFARWLFGSPFRSLPPVFGDQTPPDLRVFEAEVEEARHEVQEVPGPAAIHDRRSKPARRK
jgi:hypothetical protein